MPVQFLFTALLLKCYLFDSYFNLFSITTGYAYANGRSALDGSVKWILYLATSRMLACRYEVLLYTGTYYRLTDQPKYPLHIIIIYYDSTRVTAAFNLIGLFKRQYIFTLIFAIKNYMNTLFNIPDGFMKLV